MNSKKNESPNLSGNSPLKPVFKKRAAAPLLLFLVSFAVFIPSLSSGFVWDDITFIEKRVKRLRTSGFNIKTFFSQGRSRAEKKERRQERRKEKRIERKEEKKEKRKENRRLKRSERGNKSALKSPKMKLDIPGQVNGEGEIENTRKYFRPVHSTSLRLDAKLWGSPFGFHLTNIILHSISTVLLYFLFLLVLKEFNVAGRHAVSFLSAMLFALYPLHVESVSFISARGDMLAAVFFFLTFIFYIRSYERFIYIVPAAISFYLSFLSKEVALSFPIVIVGFDLIGRRFKSTLNLIKYSILALIVLVYLYLRSGSRMGLTKVLGEREYIATDALARVWEVLAVFFNSYLFYLKKLVFPFDLNPFIGTIAGGDLLYTSLSIIVIVILVITAAVSIKKKENVTGFSLLLIFATLGPAVMIAVFPVAITRFSERFLYIPSAGVCLLAGYLIIIAGRRLRRKGLSYICGAILCLAFLVVTLGAQSVWKDELSLWEYAVRKSPREIVPKIHYARSLVDEGRADEAIIQYKESLGPQVYGNTAVKSISAQKLADLYSAKGDFNSAESALLAALELDPEYEESFNFNMGLISLKKNDPDSAERYLVRVTEINPNNVSAYYLLGSIYLIKAQMEEGQTQQKKEYFEAALPYLKQAVGSKRSNPEANLKLAQVYLYFGDIESAKEQAGKAVRNGIQGRALQEAQSILNMQ